MKVQCAHVEGVYVRKRRGGRQVEERVRRFKRSQFKCKFKLKGGVREVSG
jgi:hypothetical protein